MARLTGVIGGSNLYSTFLFREAKRKVVETAFGQAEMYFTENIAFIPRHGSGRNIPPHRINHRANLSALSEAGVSKVVGLCMAGSLKKSIKPPAIVIPHDYISFQDVPTFFDDKLVHITPRLDETLRGQIRKTASKNRIRIFDNGVYVQTRGPRLETEAEVRVLKEYADIVGMTMASEATLAQELDMGYAALCSVDNYANGIANNPLDFRRILKDAESHNSLLLRLLLKTLEDLK